MIDKFDNDELEKEENIKLSEEETITNSGKQESMIVDIDVRPNDHKVLNLLGEDKSRYTFNGLVRKLGIHQETLSRVLQRLGDLGLIEKSKLGYKLSEKGQIITTTGVKTRSTYVPLFQTYIPSTIDVNEIVYTLAGKWFKGLGWLGMIDGEMGPTLQWNSDKNSFQLNLRVVNGYVVIESNATSDDDKVQAMIAAYGIFTRILQHLRTSYGNGHASFYRTFSSSQLN